jgi:branched-chain amino acid transport system permease protein
MAGFFIPVESGVTDLWNLRGGPVLFYYVILFLVVGALALNRYLLRSRLGYYWLAIREEPEAAQALGINIFRYKMVAVTISAALTALGGVFIAFYYNNLFPSQVFAMHRSIEIILAPIIGGLGTLFGPVLGAFILTPLGEVVTAVLHSLGIAAAGVKQLFYGLTLLLIIKFLPGGVWPTLWRRLGLGKDGEAE